MIGVDRKSTDKTLKIAKQYADVLFRFNFRNDFSEIRNLLIKKSSGSWILVSDGHETWHNIETIPEMLLLTPANVNAIAFLLRMNPDEGNSSGQQLRLFRNIPEIRYKNKVHNELIEHGESLATDRVWIYHERSEKKRAERSGQRAEMTSEYFTSEIKINPNNPRALYYLGTFYLSQSAKKDDSGRIIESEVEINQEMLAKAIEYLERYIKVSQFYEEKYLAKWYLAQAYFHSGNYNKTKEIGFDMFEMMSEFPLGQEILGELYMHDYKKNKNKRSLPLAETWFKLARTNKKPFVSCFFPEPFFTWVAWERLTELYSIAAQEQPERILDAVIAAEQTLKYEDFPETRRIELQRILQSWKEMIGENTDSGRSGNRQPDNVHTINTGNGGTLQNKSGRVGTKFNVANLPDYIEKQQCSKRIAIGV